MLDHDSAPSGYSDIFNKSILLNIQSHGIILRHFLTTARTKQAQSQVQDERGISL